MNRDDLLRLIQEDAEVRRALLALVMGTEWKFAGDTITQYDGRTMPDLSQAIRSGEG